MKEQKIWEYDERDEYYNLGTDHAILEVNQLAEEYKEKPILKNYVDGQEIEPYGRPRVYMAIEDLNELKAYRDLGTLHQIRAVIDRYHELNDSYHQLIKEEHNNGWIPCSERMPEEKVYNDGFSEPSDDVLVFTKDGDCKVSRYWGNRRNKRDYYDWVDIKCRKDDVVAWQPLPAPYKGEQK